MQQNVYEILYMPSIRTTLRRIPNTLRRTMRLGKQHRYKTPEDVMGFHTLEDFMYIDPSDVDGHILDEGKKGLTKEQHYALRKLLAIKRVSKDFPKGIQRDEAVNKMKQNELVKLDPHSSFNREVGKLLAEVKTDVDLEARLNALKSKSPLVSKDDAFIQDITARLNELKKPSRPRTYKGGRRRQKRSKTYKR